MLFIALYFFHFCRISDLEDPKERMLQNVRWYLSAFHAGRKGAVAKKPYNPILGETFNCYWDLDEASQSTESDGTNEASRVNEVSLVYIRDVTIKRLDI